MKHIGFSTSDKRQPDSIPVRIYARADLGNISGPRLSGDWVDNDEFFVALSWGNHYSDPVWSISVEVRLSPRLTRLADRHWPRHDVSVT